MRLNQRFLQFVVVISNESVKFRESYYLKANDKLKHIEHQSGGKPPFPTRKFDIDSLFPVTDKLWSRTRSDLLRFVEWLAHSSAEER
jgi:hypothetical protein